MRLMLYVSCFAILFTIFCIGFGTKFSIIYTYIIFLMIFLIGVFLYFTPYKYLKQIREFLNSRLFFVREDYKTTFIVLCILSIFGAVFLGNNALGIFIILLGVSLYYGLGGQLFFILSLISMLRGIVYMFGGQESITEQIFIYVYYGLVAGVITELLVSAVLKPESYLAKYVNTETSKTDNKLISSEYKTLIITGTISLISISLLYLQKKYIDLPQLYLYISSIFIFVIGFVLNISGVLKGMFSIRKKQFGIILCSSLLVFIISIFYITQEVFYQLLIILLILITTIYPYVGEESSHITQENNDDIFSFSVWLFLGLILTMYIVQLFNLNGLMGSGIIYGVVFGGVYFIATYLIEKYKIMDFDGTDNRKNKKIMRILIAIIIYILAVFGVFYILQGKDAFYKNLRLAPANEGVEKNIITPADRQSAENQLEPVYTTGLVKDYFTIDNLPIGWDSLKTDILTLQKILRFIGYYMDDIDGLYTTETKIALKQALINECGYTNDTTSDDNNESVVDDANIEFIYDDRAQECLKELPGQIEEQYIDNN